MSEATQALPPPANGSHPSPGAPQHYPPAERAHPPDAESTGHLQGPPMGGVGRGDGMTSVSAADLVARLQSGALSSQMLMDAFSTMPQVTTPPPFPFPPLLPFPPHPNTSALVGNGALHFANDSLETLVLALTHHSGEVSEYSKRRVVRSVKRSRVICSP